MNPANMNPDEIRIAVMKGELSPDWLPGNQAAKKARDQARTEFEKSGRKEPTYRDVPGEGKIAVPESVLAAEAADPEHRQRVFLRTIDRQGYPWTGWQLPPPPKPARVLEAEEYFKVPYKYDPITSQYIKAVIHQKPPWMASVDDKLDPDDNRRSRYDYQRETWYFPMEEPNLGQIPRERPDLVSPHGFPLTGGDPAQVGRGYYRPMGSVEEPGEFDDHVSALASRIDAEAAAAEKGGAE